VITARALGVYVYLQTTGAHISAESLSSIFPEGREAMSTSLRELRELGLIETKKARVNGRIMTVSQLVESDNWAPETRLLSQQSQLNSNKSLIAYSFNSKPNSEQSSREVNVEYFESEDERLEAQRKWREKKHAEKMEIHESRRQEKMLRRNPANASGWSPTDSAFEFAEQMHNLWHIQPWQVTRSRFRYALADKRKEYNTDGALELQMMALFFSQIKHDTKLSDPEIVWKKFILQFHNLLTEVQRSMVTPEKMEAIKEKSTRSLDWMNDV
jgi:hypothetical protein